MTYRIDFLTLDLVTTDNKMSDLGLLVNPLVSLVCSLQYVLKFLTLPKNNEMRRHEEDHKAWMIGSRVISNDPS